jgi:hypothetical protein
MIKRYLFNLSSIQPKSGVNTAISNLDQTISLTHPLGHQVSFHFDVTKDDIIFSTNIIEPKTKFNQPKQPHPEWYYHDHFVLMLDPKNDHMYQYLIGINKDGSQINSIQVVLPGEELSDRLTKNINADHFVFKKEIVLSATGWTAKVQIPLKSLGLEFLPSVMGVKVKYGFESEIIYDAVTWPTTKSDFGDAPMDYGSLLTNTDLLVNKVDFGTPIWKTGDFTTNLIIEGKSPTQKDPLEVVLTVTDALGKSQTNKSKLEVNANGNFEFKGNVDCHFANKWAPDFLKTARVSIEIKDKNKVVWNAIYPLGFDAGIILREPFGKFNKAKINRPQKNDPNFVDNFRCYLFSKLPNWVYQTTRDKAPSDFYLKDLDGKFNLNLMDENSLEQIADYLKSQFDNWQDALCAASLLLHHHFLTRHTASWNTLSGRTSTAGVLRLGGCFCGDTARISAHVADLLGERFKVKLKGYSLGLRGHLTGLVETPVGEILLDPMLGIYYHTLDNERLATIQEMREDKKIQERMWLLAYSNGHEFFIHTYNQVKTPYKKGDFEYPGY